MLSSPPTPQEASPPWIYCSIIKPTQVQNTKAPQINHQLDKLTTDHLEGVL